jgi:hypothetical protein
MFTPEPPVLARGDDGFRLTLQDGGVAPAGVMGPVRRDRADLLVLRVWSMRAGSIGLSPSRLEVNSTARMSQHDIAMSSSVTMIARAFLKSRRLKAAGRKKEPPNRPRDPPCQPSGKPSSTPSQDHHQGVALILKGSSQKPRKKFCQSSARHGADGSISLPLVLPSIAGRNGTNDSVDSEYTVHTSDFLETEVKDAILVTLERETANGSLWFPRKRAAAAGGLGDPLAAVFLYRTSRLSGLMQQIVRLAHVMDHAGATKGATLRRPPRFPAYLSFLHHSLPQLTTAHFRTRIATAQMRGCFSGDFWITADEIELLDPRLAVEPGSGFEIGFNQMPEIAAVLDIVHNMLG